MKGTKPVKRFLQKLSRVIVLAGMFTLLFYIGKLAAGYVNGDSLFPMGILTDKPEDRVILLIGVDARNKNEPSRSDTMILAFLHPEDKRVELVSVPRDSRVMIEGQPRARKINFAHAKGGPPLLMETIENEFGINPEGYVEIDFDAFANVIDILGGVTINVEKRMYYPEEGIDLFSGKQALNGHDALAYCRFRSDGLGDIGRIERQQKFMRAAVRQYASVDMVLKSPEIIKAIKKNLKTDLSVKELMDLASALDPSVKVRSHMLPGEAQMIGGGSYWVVDDEKARELLQEVQAPKLEPETKPGSQSK
ncbi:MAG: LCP family protein [Solirubrobacterales bacterium]